LTELWIEFIVMAFFIIVAGTYLSKYGDIIADETGLGQALIGGILVAAATSLPELVTSITSALVGAPDIAIGNVFGSNTFNLMILALSDLLHGPGPLLLRVRYSHILSGLLGILLSGIVVFSLMVSHLTGFSYNVFGIGIDSIILMGVYLIGVRLIFRYEKKNPLDKKEEDNEESSSSMGLKKAAFGFAICAAVIVFSGIRLSVVADQIARLTGIDQSFIGSILVAAATSLPELVATISALSINAYNMAIGNVLGSNIFNMTIVFFADAFYRKGNILADAKIVHIITAMVGLLMSAIVMIGLFYRSKRTILSIGWDSMFVAIIYFLGVYLLFQLGVNV